MMHPTMDIQTFMRPGARVHLAGIGGVSMCPLAEVLAGMGLVVQGSDMTESDTVRHLRDQGIEVAIGHSAENLKDCDLVIRTAAIHDSNPEIAGAIARGIPVYERAQAWGAIMQQYPNAVCISGTHGKTTTTSMATHIFMAADADPTVMIGGTLPLLHSGYRVGKGETIILESCEYCNSFLNFFPTVAVILNVEEDHLDFFKDLADIEHSFHAFADLVPQRGYVIANADDTGAREAVKGLAHPVFTFGVTDQTADCVAQNVSFHDGCPAFDVVIHGEFYCHIELKVAGKHNVLNALAAASAAYVLGISGGAVTRGLATFYGAGRRFEHKGSFHGAEVYDDYAHHPGELHALLTTARTMPYERVICAFQPHTYTRTKALFDEFVQELKLPDVTILAEIYAAREKNDIGISSQDLAAQIPGAIYCSSLDKVADTLAQVIRPGDLVLTVGAGDIFRAGEKLLERA
ncbi:MAG: UDP-N-acetylmuramate--L-alanine ligase [Clostridiales bacterium]|nr:UDP-N-acetylmuramate--L-alanine ligase [Candidatus Cacconaster stercorequi]